jgi:hypothetical protein
MLVATLIATVVFAAAFTVLGGNNQESGIPILLRNNWFMVFFVSDAITLFSSSTSIVIFLSILTSRYTEKDFFNSLPTKLAFGLATLFISIVGMVVAFSATCFLVYNSKITWAPVVIITAASIPVTFFVLLHYTLSSSACSVQTDYGKPEGRKERKKKRGEREILFSMLLCIQSLMITKMEFNLYTKLQ